MSFDNWTKGLLLAHKAKRKSYRVDRAIQDRDIIRVVGACGVYVR